MSGCPSQAEVEQGRLHEKSYQEELQLNLDEVSAKLHVPNIDK